MEFLKNDSVRFYCIGALRLQKKEWEQGKGWPQVLTPTLRAGDPSITHVGIFLFERLY
jgi:hypothetical protein